HNRTECPWSGGRLRRWLRHDCGLHHRWRYSLFLLRQAKRISSQEEETVRQGDRCTDFPRLGPPPLPIQLAAAVRQPRSEEKHEFKRAATCRPSLPDGCSTDYVL